MVQEIIIGAIVLLLALGFYLWYKSRKDNPVTKKSGGGPGPGDTGP